MADEVATAPTGAQLAVMASALQWELEQLSYDLPGDRVTAANVERLAGSLTQFVGLLRHHVLIDQRLSVEG